MRCSFRTHFKVAGWSTAKGCKLLLHAGIVGIGCNASMVLEWQLDIVCCRPWLQSFVAYCCHSFCTCNAQLGLPQNAVHSSSITIFGASLSDPHPVCCMAGSAMYVGMSLYILMANFAVSACYNFAHNGVHIVTFLDRMAWGENGCCLWTFLIFLAEHFKWSLYWTKWKQQSKLARHQWYTLWNCEYERLLQLYSYVLQFQNTLQWGWLKHSNRMQIALACRHGVSCLGKDTLQKGWLKDSNKVHIALAAGIVGIGYHLSMVLEW